MTKREIEELRQLVNQISVGFQKIVEDVRELRGEFCETARVYNGSRDALVRMELRATAQAFNDSRDALVHMEDSVGQRIDRMRKRLIANTPQYEAAPVCLFRWKNGVRQTPD